MAFTVHLVIDDLHLIVLVHVDKGIQLILLEDALVLSLHLNVALQLTHSDYCILIEINIVRIASILEHERTAPVFLFKFIKLILSVAHCLDLGLPILIP